jgi:hypothetical protein
MLVSIAVLVLLMTFIGQMMSSVTSSTTLSTKHIDTDSQARLVFDRMAMDFAGMPQRKDIDFIFAKPSPYPVTAGDQTDPSDKMFFYSQAPAYFSSSDTELFPAAGATQSDPKSPIALVGYCINTGSNNSGANVTPPPYCLQRLSKGLTWGGEYPAQDGPGGMTFLTFSGSNQYMSPVTCTMLSGTFAAVGSPPDYSGTDEDFELLSNQVFRLEFCFQVKDLSPGSTGTVFSNCPVAVFTDDLPGNANNNSNTSFSSDSQPNNGPQTDPPTGTLQGTNGTKIHVGDRWYNSLDGLAFICTGYTYSSAGVPVGATWAPIGLSDVTAIVVAIAIMDTNSRKTLSATQLASAASYLPDFDATPGNVALSGTVPLMATTWTQALNAQPETFAQKASIPQAAASQIRVYQRFFYLNNN